MAAAGMFAKAEHEELNRITSKSVLEKLMNIRQGIDANFTARRLIWELMQNAKDNVNLSHNEDDATVDIEIYLSNEEFIFSHNNGYFTSGHVRGLVRKYSSGDKERNTEVLGQVYKTTGRFGTGFMTTHLLSEKVQVSGTFEHDNTGLFHPFSFWLDRTGKSEAKIVEGMNEAFRGAETTIDSTIGLKRSEAHFKTSFSYPLNGQKEALAEIALEETRKVVAYMLINVPTINSVTIGEEFFEETVYRIKPINTLIYNDEYEFIIYNLLIDGKQSEQYFITVQEGEVRIIVPISYEGNNYTVLELDDTVPRIHLDFPMTGTEVLNLPFVINSPLFEPTEPRDGVSLIDDEYNEFAQLNCSLMLKGVGLYKTLISFAGKEKGWSDLYNLARIKSPPKKGWIDSSWFETEIVDDIRKRILYTEIVECDNGERIAICSDFGESQVYFPYAADTGIRHSIWKLAQKLYSEAVPREKDIDKWDEVIWNDCYKFSLPVLSEEIQNKQDLNTLADALQGKEQDAVSFLNEYYELLNTEAFHIKDIISDSFAVIPNQKGTFKNKSELSIDEEIDEELKNAIALVAVDPRTYLIYDGVNTGEGIRYSPKKQEDIIVEINNILKENNNTDIGALCDYLTSLFPKTNISEHRKLIFDFSKRVYPEDFNQKRTLTNYDEKIWEESDKKSLFYIVSKIASEKSVDKLCFTLGFENEDKTLKWLDSLVSFLVKKGFEYNINREKHPILPNQNGTFRRKDDLFLDEGNIDDTLKNIACELGHDFREDLLDKSIFLELPENRTYSITDVAEKISAFVKPILRDVDKRKEHRTTMKKFYLWMNENRGLAEEHFADLYEKRFLFLEDDDISLNIKKASEFEALMEEHGIESIEDLREHLSVLKQQRNTADNDSEKIYVTQEILASLGISSQAELEEAFKDPLIYSRFYHTSTPTIDMFTYAQGLIKRAKENIEAYLRHNPHYDCTDMEETAPTVLGGIIKNGVTIDVVTRPSDNGEVIIYYSSEKDTLDTDSAELWVDNGLNDPHILTLGRILKSTGINRIPINMN